MNESERKFHALIVPHFDSGYTLAFWLTGNDADAADAMQAASLKAFRFLSAHKGESSRAWFFQIVRNTCYSQMKGKKDFAQLDGTLASSHLNPEEAAIAGADAERLHLALARLSAPAREILILRELQECSYEEIAEVLNVPLGTVMSRLARARDLLKAELKGVRP